MEVSIMPLNMILTSAAEVVAAIATRRHVRAFKGPARRQLISFVLLERGNRPLVE